MTQFYVTILIEFGNDCSCCPLVNRSKYATALVTRIKVSFGIFLTHLLQNATDNRVFIQVLMDGFFGGVANILVREAYDWIDLQIKLSIIYCLFLYDVAVLKIKKSATDILCGTYYLPSPFVKLL